jgi:hypothetical protein
MRDNSCILASSSPLTEFKREIDVEFPRNNECNLFHSIWYAVSIGITSSISLTLAIKQAKVSTPLKKHLLLRAVDDTFSQLSISLNPARLNTSTL